MVHREGGRSHLRCSLSLEPASLTLQRESLVTYSYQTGGMCVWFACPINKRDSLCSPRSKVKPCPNGSRTLKFPATRSKPYVVSSLLSPLAITYESFQLAVRLTAMKPLTFDLGSRLVVPSFSSNLKAIGPGNK